MSFGITQGRVDLARLVERIRSEFADLRFADAALNDLGEDHAVVMLDDRWVFRFPRSVEAAAYGTGERRLLARLNDLSSVATPRYEHVSRAGDFGGYWMIAGRELTETAFATLPRGAQERVLSEIGGFLRVLHALPAELAGIGRIFEDAGAYAARYAERRSRLADVVGPAMRVRLDRFYRELPAAVATPVVTVIHGDLTEDHILLDPSEGNVAGVIDFTDAALGDPAFDFTFLWAYGDWAPAHAAKSYGAGAETEGLLRRSLWWFVRYRIDQVWWNESGARAYDVGRIVQDLPGLLDTLGV
jgi:aminoglycoside 2''-phosphotransferase